jgi:hypothetical protein
MALLQVESFLAFASFLIKLDTVRKLPDCRVKPDNDKKQKLERGSFINEEKIPGKKISGYTLDFLFAIIE